MWCATGACALDYLHLRGMHSEKEEAPRPAFILLDYHLPDMSGDEVLKAIKRGGQYESHPGDRILGGDGSAPHPVHVPGRGELLAAQAQDAETLKHTTEKIMAYWLALVLLPEEERPRAARGEPH